MSDTTKDAADDAMPRFHGIPDGAGAVVTVWENVDGLDMAYECVCPACWDIYNVGLEEAVDEGVDLTVPGVYYLRRATDGEGERFMSWLEINERPEDE